MMRRFVPPALALALLLAPPSPARAGEAPRPARVALLVRAAAEADFAREPALASRVEFLRAFAGPGAADRAEARREILLARALARELTRRGFDARFAAVALDRFDARLPLARPERLFAALDGLAFRTLVDLRAPRAGDRAPGAAELLDAALSAHDRLVAVAPTGDLGRDADGDGRADPGSAAGELSAARGALAVGASERFLPLRPAGPGGAPARARRDRFPAAPLSEDAPDDAPRGLYADSGRGGAGVRGPDLVAPGEPAPDTDEVETLPGTRHAALEAARAAVEARTDLAGRGHPDPSAALVRALLVALSEDLSPGQFGTGRHREIAGRPDGNQGFGRIGAAPADADLRFRDDRRGLSAGRRFRLPLDFPGDAPVPVAVALDGPPGAFELVVRRADGAVVPSAGEEGGRIRLVTATLSPAHRYEALVTATGACRGRAPFALVARRR